jgi:antitoxin MazE
METTISKWGNSLGVRIPAALAKQLGYKDGFSLRMKVENRKLVIEPARQSLKELVDQITPDNTHRLVDFGTPAGREVW